MTELEKAAMRMAMNTILAMAEDSPKHDRLACETLDALTQALATTEPVPAELAGSHWCDRCNAAVLTSCKGSPGDTCPKGMVTQTERKGPLSKDQIREVFLTHGFTVKEGQTDLKPYVYDAAYALIALVQQATERKGEPVTVEAVATVGDCAELRWLVEGGVTALPPGVILLVVDKVITDGDGQGEVYTSPQVPEGFALVPVEPTPEMIRCAEMWDDGFEGAYARALDAAREGE